MKHQLIMENFRKFIREAEEEEAMARPAPEAAPEAPPEAAPEAEAGGTWPADAPKDVPLTGKGIPDDVIRETWARLASMNPPKNAEEELASIGGMDKMIANVRLLEKQFAGADQNPKRIEMPVVDPDRGEGEYGQVSDLGTDLSQGELDVKPPFAPDMDSKPSEEDFPRDLNKDPEAASQWLRKGKADGNPNDDSAVTLSPTPIAVSKSYPTQNAVYLDKCMYNIMNFGGTKPGGEAFGKPNLIAIQDGDKNFILDGHHRWASAFVSGGPGASIRVQALKGLDVATAIAALRSYGNAKGNAQKG